MMMEVCSFPVDDFMVTVSLWLYNVRVGKTSLCLFMVNNINSMGISGS
jgi:hypothetical protein